MISFKSQSIDITPTQASILTGMGQNERSKGIHSHLEINMMMFQQLEKIIYFVSIDTLFISQAIKDFITKEINLQIGKCDEADILVMSTHTHYAPSIKDYRYELGVKDESYFEFLKQKITALITQIKAVQTQDIELSIQGAFTKDLTCNRRRKARSIAHYLKPFIAMEPNLDGFKEEKIDIINIIDQHTKALIGLIWTFPCHPTNLFDKALISAEFIGSIRDAVRLENNDKPISVLYLPGFMGNVRAYPPPRFSIGKLMRSIFQLSYPVSYYRFQNEQEYNVWIDALKSQFMNIWQTSTKSSISDMGFKTQLIKKDVTQQLGISSKACNELIFRKVNFAKSLAIVSISAEVLAEYRPLIADLIKEEHCLCTGYVDQVFGYLPTIQQIKEGGYESKGYFRGFLVTGEFNSNIENNIKACIKEMN